MSSEELFAALDACAERDRLLTRLARATTEQDRAQQSVDRARQQVSTETGELKALEEFGPTQLWTMLRGTHASEVEREQAELAAADYQADLANGALSEAGGPAAQELIGISTQRAASLAASHEVTEAQDAASRAAARLKSAISELDHAEDLADLDVVLRGGFLIDSAKYQRIDQAVTQLRSAGEALKKLSAELADVRLPTIPGLDIPDLTQTFDIWFDNFFTDLSVRSRIREAAASSRRAFDAVVQVSKELSRRQSELITEQEQLAQQRLAVMAR